MDAQIIRDRISVLEELMNFPGETAVLTTAVLFDESSMSESGLTIIDTQTSVLYIGHDTVMAERVGEEPIMVKRTLVRYTCTSMDMRGFGWLCSSNEPDGPASIQMHDNGELAAWLTDEQFGRIVAGMRQSEQLQGV